MPPSLHNDGGIRMLQGGTSTADLEKAKRLVLAGRNFEGQRAGTLAASVDNENGQDDSRLSHRGSPLPAFGSD
jgi:hypothetical protein